MTEFLLLAFVFLIAGVISVPIASRLGLGSVLGYLIAGIAISPLLALLGVDVISIQHFAEFGVVMMLFLVGLELEPKLLWAMRMRLLGLGGGQVGVTTLLIMGAAMALGLSWSISLAIGLILALSSTAIVLQTLQEKNLMKTEGGEASFAVLLFEDIAVIPMLALIPLLAVPELVDLAQVATDASHGAADHGGGGHGDGEHGSMSLVDGLNGWQTALVNIAAIAAVILGGNYLTSPIFRFIAVARLRELFTAAALMIVIGIALLMTLVGLSPALGTFLAGVVLANSEYRHELESDIDPFRGLLLGLFFMTVGASINFVLLMDNFAVIMGLALGVMFIKGLVLYGLAVIFKIKGTDRWLFTLGMAQAGEFSFVLISFSVANAVLPAGIAEQLLLVVAISMLLTPALFILHDKVISPRFSEEQTREADDIHETSPIIIAGRGRIGGIVDRMLKAAGHSPVVVDYNSRQLEVLQRFGIKTYFGDATRPDLLAAAGIGQAKLLVVAIDGREQITELVKYVVKNHPHVHITARAVDRDHVYELWAHGCRDIIRETYDSSIRMGRASFEALGIEHETAMDMARAFDRADRDLMIQMADAYKLDIPVAENEEYIARVRAIRTTWEPEVQAKLQAIQDGKRVEAASLPASDEVTDQAGTANPSTT